MGVSGELGQSNTTDRFTEPLDDQRPSLAGDDLELGALHPRTPASAVDFVCVGKPMWHCDDAIGQALVSSKDLESDGTGHPGIAVYWLGVLHGKPQNVAFRELCPSE